MAEPARMPEEIDGVVCASIPAIDGWTGKQCGWLYGFHFIGSHGATVCPRCGANLRGDIDGGAGQGNVAPTES